MTESSASRDAWSVRANAAHQAADAAFFSSVVGTRRVNSSRAAAPETYFALTADIDRFCTYTLMQAVATPAPRPAHLRHGRRSISRCNMPNDWRGWAVSALMLLLLLAHLRGCSV